MAVTRIVTVNDYIEATYLASSYSILVGRNIGFPQDVHFRTVYCNLSM